MLIITFKFGNGYQSFADTPSPPKNITQYVFVHTYLFTFTLKNVLSLS